MRWFIQRSGWILHYNAGSCNGCDIEFLATLAPKYDIERFGMRNTANPKHADIFFVTGPVTQRTHDRLITLYEQIPHPKVVVACGVCACSGGLFRGMYGAEEGIESCIPVDVYIGGCPPTPEQIIEGLLHATSLIAQKGYI